MTHRITLIIVLFGYCMSMAQNIHPLESSKNHYKLFQSLDSAPNSERAHLDKIVFPASSYNSGSLIYTIAKPEYLNEVQVEQLKSFVKFPANSSDQTKAELDFLRAWEVRRTIAQEQRAVEVLAPIGYWPHISLLKNHLRYHKNMEHLFYEGRTVMGDQCNATNYPDTGKLLEGVTKDMRIIEFTVKYHLLRPRPYHLDTNLNPLAQMSTPSFASGHTLWAYIQAFVWSELIPEKRSQFLDIAYEIGESREIMGIHYPSDEEAARLLAHKMLELMSDNKTFRLDLDKAKKEWN